MTKPKFDLGEIVVCHRNEGCGKIVEITLFRRNSSIGYKLFNQAESREFWVTEDKIKGTL